MTEIHDNSIFFGENSLMRSWVKEEQKNEFHYHQVNKILTSCGLISAHQFKFYFKRRCRDGHK